MSGLEKENRKDLITIIISAVLLLSAMAVEHFFRLPLAVLLLIYLVPYLIAGGEVLLEAVRGIGEGEIFGEELLMSIATLGALAIGFLPGAEPQFAEAVFVMLFFKIGELFEEIAEGKSRKSVSALMDLRPDSAVIISGGEAKTVSPDEVEPGEIIIIKPGERIPLDGVIIEGTSSLNTSALTGESLPRTVKPGDSVFSGCVNINGLIKIKVTKRAGESTAERILELVENAQQNKSKNEAFITKFARVYTPAVVVLAVMLAIVPPLVSGSFKQNFAPWLYRALTFLTVSCPCALVISVPLAFFGGIGGAGKKGILIKGSAFVEALAGVKSVAFDKTGTLTEGVFEVTRVNSEKVTESELLHLAAHAESFSNHPISEAIRRKSGECDKNCVVSDYSELAGKGVTAKVNGKTVLAGSAKLVENAPQSEYDGTVVHISENGEYLGSIEIADKIRNESKKTIKELASLGISKIVMLTGDNERTAAAVSEKLGITEYHAELLPQGKADALAAIIKSSGKNEKVAFVGDGVNDAPVLALADVGIAMGGLGSDAAIEAADVVLMDDNIGKLIQAVKLCRRTLRIAKQNIIFAFAVKAAVLIFAALGTVPMGLAVFADVGVTVLAVLNSIRTLRN